MLATRSTFAVYLFACIFTITSLPVSAIVECPQYQVPKIREYAETFELSLLFYHTAWSNRSKAALKIFSDVADYYNVEQEMNILFGGIDCFHLLCNCSRTHVLAPGSGAPNKWPTLMVRVGRHVSLEYHGEWNTIALVRFVDALLRPLKRIHNKNELTMTSMQSDGVVLGLFPNADGIEYRKFASASVKWLETDPERGYRFVAAIGVSAAKALLGVAVKEQNPVILLINGKRLQPFNTTNAWSTNQIVLWLQAELKRAHNHIHGYNSPATLATQMRNGPVLALFANANFYEVMENEFDILNPYSLSSSFCAINDHQHFDQDQLFYNIEEEPTVCSNRNGLNSRNLKLYYQINKLSNHMICQSDPSCLQNDGDPNTADELLRLHRSNACFLQYLHYNFNAPQQKIAIAKFLKKSIDLQWRPDYFLNHNRSLSLVILETNKYKDFLHSLGIPNTNSSDATVFISDTKKESIFLMHEKFSYHSLLAFIVNFYKLNFPTAHHSRSSYYLLPLSPSSALNALYLHDLNREIFFNVINQQNITIVILLYSPQCAFSAIMSQTLIQISAMLLDNNDIKIFRINTQDNDLPWEFVMPFSPNLIVFPRGLTMESRVFPLNIRADVRNVFGFILAQMEPIDQVKTILSSCRRNLLPERLLKCLQFAKAIATQHIGHHLKLWQIFEKERYFILERLKAFKDISLDIKRSFMF